MLLVSLQQEFQEMTTETKNTSEILNGDGLEAFFSTKEKQEDGKEKTDNSKTEAPKEDKKEELKKETSLSEEEKPTGGQNVQKFYKNLIQDFVEDGDWEDVDVEVEIDGETKTVPIQELDNMSEEMFRELKASQKELKEKKFQESYLSKEGLDETTLKMIELKKSGGDLSQLIETEVQQVHPLKGLDLDQEQVQEHLLRQKYASQGIEQGIVDLRISKMKEDLTLDTEAQKVIEEVNNNFKAYVDSEAERQKEAIEASKEEQKKFRKSVSESLKSLDIKNDSLRKSLLDASTKQDENGLSQVDKAFFEAKSDPELFTKVALMLTNQEDFNNIYGTKFKNKANKDAVKTVLSLKRRSAEKPSAKTNKKESGLGALFDAE